jgi:hypothetical protein
LSSSDNSARLTSPVKVDGSEVEFCQVQSVGSSSLEVKGCIVEKAPGRPETSP